MGKIEIIREDITRLSVGAIVNAANTSLLGGGGVDGAIHRSAGPELLKACRLLNGCNTGEAKITPGFNLPSRNVIHTVGPVWKNGNQNENELLASCYVQSLRLASDNNISTIAFPNISTGVYGFPRQEAAKIALKTVHDYLKIHPEIVQVLFCCFDEENFKIYNSLFYSQISIEKVQSTTDMRIVATLAFTIWHEHYVPIIGQEQVDYMVGRFQSAEAIQNQINIQDYEYYIIYHGGEPSGYLSIKLNCNELFLSKIYILREKRGTGLGKAALKFAANRATTLGAQSITLTVNKHNLNSIKAYEKMGFKNEGSVIADIGSGYVMDDYQMRLEL